MLGFLMLPVTPVQFTSILTAVVWIFSGIQYAAIFNLLGTFRFDSVPIYDGIERILHLGPGYVVPFSQPVTLMLMFLGNLATAYLFKRTFVSGLIKRIRVR